MLCDEVYFLMQNIFKGRISQGETAPGSNQPFYFRQSTFMLWYKEGRIHHLQEEPEIKRPKQIFRSRDTHIKSQCKIGVNSPCCFPSKFLGITLQLLKCIVNSAKTKGSVMKNELKLFFSPPVSQLHLSEMTKVHKLRNLILYPVSWTLKNNVCLLLLYSWFPLAICFTHGGVHMSSLISSFILSSPAPTCPHVQEGRLCICLADSFCCIEETNTDCEANILQ